MPVRALFNHPQLKPFYRAEDECLRRCMFRLFGNVICPEMRKTTVHLRRNTVLRKSGSIALVCALLMKDICTC